MPTEIVKAQKVWFDGYELTGVTNQPNFEVGVEMQDDTTLGDNTRSNKPGLKTVSASVAGFWDPLVTDPALFNNLRVENKPFSFGYVGTEGGPADFFLATVGSYKIGAQVGNLCPYDAMAASQGDRVRGIIAANRIGISGVGNGSVFQLGAVAAGQTLHAALHVLGVNDPGDGLVVRVQSNATGTFSGGQTTRLTFASANAIGSQYLTLAGPVTQQFWRVDWPTMSGSTPAFAFVVLLGIV